MREENTFRRAVGDWRGERERDLGFGEKVAGESPLRLLNRDGSFNVRRTGLGFYARLNLYHSLLNISWKGFIGLTLSVYFLSNVVFGSIYASFGAEALIDTSEVPIMSMLLRGFFFSVQTFATIGYGTIHPVGVVPNLLVTVESYYSMILTALLTGIVFARFSRPTARIFFSKFAIIAPYQDKTALMIRLTNTRQNQLIDVRARFLFTRTIEENGRVVRKFDTLELERDRVFFLPLAWTIVHPIDEESPLHGMTPEDLEKHKAEFVVLINASDETYAQTVHARTSYKPEEMRFGYKFVNLYNEVKDGEPISINVRKLSRIEKA